MPDEIQDAQVVEEKLEFQTPMLTRHEAGYVGAKSDTISDRLRREERVLKSRLAEVSAALAALDGNPAVQHVLDSVSKVQHL